MNIPFAASIPYFFYFYFLAILIFFKKIKSKNQILFLLFIVFLIVFIFYEGNYSDWRTYRAFVKTCTCIGCTYFEPLYDLLTYVSSQTIGFKLIPLVSLFLLFYFFVILKKYVLNSNMYVILILSISMAYLPLYYGALRQSIAFSILLFSLLSLQNKTYFTSFILFLLATGFHLSSIVIYFLVIVYFTLWKISNKNFFKFIFLIITSFILGFFILKQLMPYLSVIDSFNPGFKNATPNPLKLILLPLERFMILIFAFYTLFYNKNNRIIEYLSIISIIGSIFYLVMYKFSLNTAGRVVVFFRLADIFVIYYFIKIFVQKRYFELNYKETLNNIALFCILIYSIVKFYFTIISVGFFR